MILFKKKQVILFNDTLLWIISNDFFLNNNFSFKDQK